MFEGGPVVSPVFVINGSIPRQQPRKFLGREFPALCQRLPVLAEPLEQLGSLRTVRQQVLQLLCFRLEVGVEHRFDVLREEEVADKV